MRNYINYFTEIEEHFQQRRGSLLLLSTLDWVLIDTWREAGLPLEVVLRGIDTAFDKHDLRQQQAVARGKRLRPVNGLAWCAQAILESAEQTANASLADTDDATSSAAGQDSGFEAERLVSFLRRSAESVAAACDISPLATQVLAEVASRLRELAAEREPARNPNPPVASADAGLPSLEELDRTLSTLEERLVAALLTSTPEAELAALRQQADRELAPVRSRLGAVQLRQLQQQFLHRRLLDQHKLPRLSLFYMNVA